MPAAGTCSRIVRDRPIFGTSVGLWHSMIAVAVIVTMNMTVRVIVMAVLWFLVATDSCLFFKPLCTARVKSSRVTTSSLQTRMRQ